MIYIGRQGVQHWGGVMPLYLACIRDAAFFFSASATKALQPPHSPRA